MGEAAGPRAAGVEDRRVVAGEENDPLAVVAHRFVDVEEALHIGDEGRLARGALEQIEHRVYALPGLVVRDPFEGKELPAGRGGEPTQALLQRLQQQGVPVAPGKTQIRVAAFIGQEPEGRLAGGKGPAVVRPRPKDRRLGRLFLPTSGKKDEEHDEREDDERESCHDREARERGWRAGSIPSSLIVPQAADAPFLAELGRFGRAGDRAFHSRLPRPQSAARMK